jgi:chitinase
LDWPEPNSQISGNLGASPAATLSIADASVVEGNRGSRQVQFSVTLSNASSQAITVSYRTVDGTALAKSDYSATSGTLTFQPGETSRTISVSIKGDRKREANETFSVQLSNAVGATIDDGVATVTILNDD